MRTRFLAFALAGALALPAVAAAEPPAAFQGGPGHPGNVEADVAPPLGKRWARADLGRPGAPIVYDGRVFVTTTPPDRSTGGTPALHALDAATGKTLWAVPGVSGRVSAAAGLVFSRSGGELVARDAGSGAVRWTTQGGDDSGAGEPVADDDFVFVSSDGIIAYRASDGLRVWRASAANPSTGPAAADAERAYVLGCGGNVLAAQRDVGVPVWEAGGDCIGGSSSPAPVVGAGRLWGDQSVHRAADGARLGPWTGNPPAVAADRTVVSQDGVLRAQDFEGRRLWEAGTPRDDYGGPTLSRPLIAGSTVYVVAPGGIVRGHDLATGREVWRSSTRVTDSFSDGPSPDLGLAARGDRLLVPFPDKLVAYGPGADTPGVDPDPWRDPAAVQLSLAKPKPAKLVFGKATVMRVAYKRTVGYDESNPGPGLVLEADPFPFGQWVDVRPVSGDEAEYQGVSVKPDRNTRYRLRDGSVTPPKHSDVVDVQVDVNFRVTYKYLSRTRLRARVTLKAPADRLTRARMKVPFYFYRKRTNRSRRIGVERLRRTAPTTARGTIVLRVPRRFGRRDSVFPCLPEKRDDGFGRFFGYQRDCGRKRF